RGLNPLHTFPAALSQTSSARFFDSLRIPSMGVDEILHKKFRGIGDFFDMPGMARAGDSLFAGNSGGGHGGDLIGHPSLAALLQDLDVLPALEAAGELQQIAHGAGGGQLGGTAPEN